MLNGHGSSSQLGGFPLWRDPNDFPAEHDGTTGGALLQRPGSFGQEDVGISPEICVIRWGLIIPIQSMYDVFMGI